MKPRHVHAWGLLLLALSLAGAARVMAFGLSDMTDSAKNLVNKKQEADKSKEQMEQECRGSFQINDQSFQAAIQEHGPLAKADCSVELRAVQYQAPYNQGLVSSIKIAYNPPDAKSKNSFVAQIGFETPIGGPGVPSANPAGLSVGSYAIPDQFTLVWAAPGRFCTYGSGTLHITASADVGGMVSGDFNATIKSGQNARCPQTVSGTFSVPHLKQ